MLKNGMTIKTRIGLAMAFLSALMLALGALGLSGMNKASKTTSDVYLTQMPSAVDIAMTESYAARERLALDRAAMHAGQADETKKNIDRAAVLRARSDSWWKKYMDFPREADEDKLAQDVVAKREALQSVVAAYTDAINANDHDKILSTADDLQAAFVLLSKSDDTLSQLQFTQSKAEYADEQSSYATFRTVTIALLVAALVAALFAYLNLRAAIAGPLAEALAYFDAIASGDLRRSIVVRTRDEMGLMLEGLAKMQRSLTDTVRTVRGGSESIAQATKQIAAGNLDLSSRTEEQAASLQQTTSSMDQLTGTVRQNADNARQASALAANASEIANKGNEVVGQVVGTMGEINDSSAKIADIITIIEGIAFQTNILALNAAVEAARAGEQGRGFAVVAGEVRALAQRSSGAAKEIKTLIDTSVDRVRSGSALVGEAGRTMEEIIAAVQRVTDIMGEIAAASEEQSTGIGDVARTVSQMDQVTQQNAALVEQASAAAQSLQEQAERLRTAVSVFQLADEGSASRTVAVRPASISAAGASKRAAKPAPTRSTPAPKRPAPSPSASSASKIEPKIEPVLAASAAPAKPAAAPAKRAQAPAESVAAKAATPARSTAAPAPAASPAPAVAPARKLPATSAPSSSRSDDDWETF
ncbi:methyl-accepting chemotaxis protein [Trinickia dinghuensis]|uniref:Methyl-accepting chemotaxis protein n=1 Tax=Trinickia dinghuensis TaxID=2291023 RepID=A0A3D8K371_9BURK|nr:methyl-accepting chemotaxis protein [Trinickia dinghuensis]RDU99325.1 methyl-accepting chemotaxis protein [Trinickia dinghuensis]